MQDTFNCCLYIGTAKVIAMNSLFETIWEFWYIMFVVFILGRFIYYPHQGKKEFLFSYLMLAAALSILCILISRVEFGLGFALGIFAVFSIMRYRTTQVPVREMTYLFLTATIAVKNALVGHEVLMSRMILADVFILVTAAVAEYFLFRSQPHEKLIIYDNMNLIHPEHRAELLKDLTERFGLSNIESVKVGRIDALKNSARLKVQYHDPADENFDDD